MENNKADAVRIQTSVLNVPLPSISQYHISMYGRTEQESVRTYIIYQDQLYFCSDLERF